MNIKIVNRDEVTEWLNNNGAGSVAFVKAPVAEGVVTDIFRQAENNGENVVDIRWANLFATDFNELGAPLFMSIDDDAVVLIDETWAVGNAAFSTSLWMFVNWLTNRGNKVIIPVRP